MVLSTVGTGARQILVSYVGEAAVWKTTYRLIFPTAADRQPTLQGWAVVDNMSAADWNNVELSLVAGEPQAFRQPLSAPLFASRPIVPLAAGAGLAPQTHAAALVGGLARIAGTVRDDNRAALPGVTVTVVDQSGRDVGRVVTDGSGRYDLGGLTPGVVSLRAQMPGFTTAQASSITLPPGGTVQRDLTLSVGALQEEITVAGRSPAPRPGGAVAGGVGMGLRAAPPPPSAALVEQRMLEQSIAASGAELGDLFENTLTDRVSIRRNQSALVPILQAAVTAERISLWNDAMGARPRRAVWLSNTSTLTHRDHLERAGTDSREPVRVEGLVLRAPARGALHAPAGRSGNAARYAETRARRAGRAAGPCRAGTRRADRRGDARRHALSLLTGTRRARSTAAATARKGGSLRPAV